MKFIKIFITITILLSSCGQRHSTNEIPTIDAYGAVKQNVITQKLSSFAQTCQYIPLETNDDCIIDVIRNFYLTDKQIIITSGKECWVFDRNNGKFLNKIGSYGQGPNEHLGFRATAWDKNKQLLYIISNYGGHLLCYNLKGEVVNRISRFNQHQMRNMSLLDSDTYIGNIGNDTGEEEKRLIVGSFLNDSIHIVPNFSFFTVEQPDPSAFLAVSDNSEVQFYQFDNTLCLKELFIDTIFEIRKPYDLIPKYVFDMKDLKFPQDLRGKIVGFGRNKPNYIFHDKSYETKDYLFSLFIYNNMMTAGILNKNDYSYLVADRQKEDTDFFGLQNDVYGGIPFWPKYISDEGEMVTWHNAYKLIEYIEENKIDIATLSDLNEDDNPVIIIAK